MRVILQLMVIIAIIICSNCAFASKRIDIYKMPVLASSGTYKTSDKVYDANGRGYNGEKLIMQPYNNNIAYLEVQLNKEYESFEGIILPLNQKNNKNRIYLDIFCDGKKLDRINNLFTERNSRHRFKYNVMNINTLTIVANLMEPGNVSGHFRPSVAFYRSKFSKHIHSNKRWVIVKNQSCIDEEVQNYICNKCNGVLDTRVSAIALGHNLDTKWIVDKKPTCSTNGSEVQKCTRCDVIINRQPINKTTHMYNDKWNVVRQSTCLEVGVETRECQVCGDVAIRDIPLVEHSIDEWVLVSGDILNNPRVYEGICDVCKKLQVKNDNSYKILEITFKYIMPLVVVVVILFYWRKGYRLNIPKSGKSLTSSELENKIREK